MPLVQRIDTTKFGWFAMIVFINLKFWTRPGNVLGKTGLIGHKETNRIETVQFQPRPCP